MRKQTQSILQFKRLAITPKQLQQLKGGGSISEEYNKLLKKLADHVKKGDTNKMFKTQDKLDCLGYVADDCCGNGNGLW